MQSECNGSRPYYRKINFTKNQLARAWKNIDDTQMIRYLFAFLSGLMLDISLGAVEPVQLAAYPQKSRTFYNLADTAVPAVLRSNSVSLPVGRITSAIRATDGALWLGTTQGLM